MDVFRIVTRSSARSAYRRSSSRRKADWLTREIQRLSDPLQAEGWHDLIARSFRPKLPVRHAFSRRFLPPNWYRNALFASCSPITSIYEVAYYFLRERVGKNISSLSQARTLFSTEFYDSKIVDLAGREDIGEIMNRHDHSKSHQIVRDSPAVNSFQYPSCRDPSNGACIVTYEISCLGKVPKTEQELSYTFDPVTNSVEIHSSITALEGAPLMVLWDSVS